MILVGSRVGSSLDAVQHEEQTCEECRAAAQGGIPQAGGKQAHDPLHCGGLRVGLPRAGHALPFRRIAVLPLPCLAASRGPA